MITNNKMAYLLTQQNAANAEESASAAEEMNAQAEQMKSYVEDLVAIVGGNRKNGNNGFQTRVNASDTIKTNGILFPDSLVNYLPSPIPRVSRPLFLTK